MTEKNKTLKVHIFDEEYALVTDELPEHIQHAAHIVDTYMREISSKLATMTEKKIAVLSALRLASQLVHEQNQKQHVSDQHQKLIKMIDQELAH